VWKRKLKREKLRDEGSVRDGDDEEGRVLKLGGKERWLSGGKATISVCNEFSRLPGQVHYKTATASKQQLPALTNSVRRCKVNAWFSVLHKQE